MTTTKSLKAKYNEEVKAAMKEKYGFTTRGITARFYRDGDPERIDARRSRTRKEKISPGL